MSICVGKLKINANLPMFWTNMELLKEHLENFLLIQHSVVKTFFFLFSRIFVNINYLIDTVRILCICSVLCAIVTCICPNSIISNIYSWNTWLFFNIKSFIILSVEFLGEVHVALWSSKSSNYSTELITKFAG